MPRSHRFLALLLVLALGAAACNGRPRKIDAGPGTTQSTTATTTTAGSTTTTITTTTGAAAPTTATDPAAVPGPGTPGLADPYFPWLGNGGYDVEHYLIDLRVDPDAGTLDGRTMIEATATGPLTAFNLDLAGLTVSSVEVDDASAAFTRDGDELTVTPVAPLVSGEAFAVTVTYSGAPAPTFLGSTGIAAGWITVPSGVYVIAEPDGARTWFPANDHPADKAAFTYRITVPEEYTVAAAGRFAGVTPAGDGFDTHVWEMTDPMATYLATIVVADLVRVDRDPHHGITLRDYLPPDLAADPPGAFALVTEMIPFLEERFGPYPFDAYGHVVVDRFPGALENQTLSIFGREALAPFIVERIVVHELAHMWFGDSVTPATWQDIWLNEGFATFAEWLWVEHTAGTEAMLDEIADTHGMLGFIPHRPPGDPGIDELFGISVYQRGGLTLHALRTVIGDEALFTTLRAYTARFAYGNATTTDFIAIAEEVSGRDLGDLFTAWLYEPEVPPLPEW